MRSKKKNGSGLTGAQDPTWFQSLSPTPVLRDTNERMYGIFSNPAATSLGDFFRQEEENKEIDEGDGKSEEAAVNSDESRMDEEDNNDTLENGEEALEHSVRTKVVTRSNGKRAAARSQLQAINKLGLGVQELARVNSKRLKVENKDRQQLLEFCRK